MCKVFLCRIPWEVLTSIKLKHVEIHILSCLQSYLADQQDKQIVPVQKNNQTHGKGIELTNENYIFQTEPTKNHDVQTVQRFTVAPACH